YGTERRTLIDPNRAAKTVAAGNLDQGDTIYMCTADDEGNMVSLIQSNYRGMGSGIVVPELGFMFQDRGELFSMEPGHANIYAARIKKARPRCAGRRWRLRRLSSNQSGDARRPARLCRRKRIAQRRPGGRLLIRPNSASRQRIYSLCDLSSASFWAARSTSDFRALPNARSFSWRWTFASAASISARSRFAVAACAASIACARPVSVCARSVFAISPAVSRFSFSNISSLAQTKRALARSNSR